MSEENDDLGERIRQMLDMLTAAEMKDRILRRPDYSALPDELYNAVQDVARIDNILQIMQRLFYGRPSDLAMARGYLFTAKRSMEKLLRERLT